MEDNEITLKKNHLEMYTVANEYCHFIEACHNYSYDEVLVYLQRMLPLLYLKGSLLVEVRPEEDALNERYVTEEQYETLFNKLREVFDSNDEFYVLDEEEKLKRSLSELLADLYQDIKDFVLLYQHPLSSAKHQAAVNLKELFSERWGPGALNALKHIHNILISRPETAEISGGADPFL